MTDGWRLVPVEPTEDMIKAGAATEGARWIDSCISLASAHGMKRPATTFDKSALAQAYRAALAVAPPPPAGEEWQPIKWRKDCYGKADHALYLRNLYVGHILSGATNHHYGEWRGWIMNDDEGNETGWFATADEARKSVEAALTAALSPPQARVSGAIDEQKVKSDER